jgi:hypothetical protein
LPIPMLYVPLPVERCETKADDQMIGMMDNPDFMRSMSEMMSRPEVVEQVSWIVQ